MDDRSAVAPAPAFADTTVRADQAIFTSIRTPTGEGYRIVAASPGVSADEKKEITQRAPSHGSLCDPAPTAVALCCYRFSSGRHCVAHSRYAGVEHTARGGQRVYTHIVVLDEASFRRFDCNPLWVHAAVGETIADAALLKPPSPLDGLSLAAGPSAGARILVPSILRTPTTADLIARLVASLLAGRQLIVVGAPAPFDLFEWTVIGLPLPARWNLAASIGLKFSRSRQMRLTWIDRDQGETQRVIRGTGIEWLDVESGLPRNDSPLGLWPEFIRRWLSQGRFRDLRRLTSQLLVDGSGSSLERIASICNDLDRLDDADPSVRENLERKYRCYAAGGGAEAELIRQLAPSLQI